MKNWRNFTALAVIFLLVAALAVSLGIFTERDRQYRQALDNVYKKSYYEAMDAINDLEMKLDKLTLAEGKNTQRTLLTEIWMQAELAESNLAQLSARDTEIGEIIRFLNQLGDYSYYLAGKTEDESLTEKEREAIEKLHEIVVTLHSSFEETNTGIMQGGTLAGRLSEGVSLLSSSYMQFTTNNTIEYPEMIYDGPFSDGLSDREAKFLKDAAEITREDAEQVIKDTFPNTTEINFLTEVGGSIAAFMFNIKWKEGEGSVEVTKLGGHIAEYSSNRNIGNPDLSEEECQAIAEEKIKEMGYEKMTPVWATNSHSMVYINFAYEDNDIIYYPDLVKIKIAADTGELMGIEAANYIYNHTGARAAAENLKTIDEARAKVSAKLNIESARLTYIPTEWNTELLAYEFSGSYKEGQYFVYIAADTLNEIKIMKVIESDGGKLIM
ncbi:MAG: PepSY1/2 domain-containing protein [Clostridia bacterium]